MTFDYLQTNFWFKSSENYLLALKQSHDSNFTPSHKTIEISDATTMENDVQRQWLSHRDDHKLYIDKIVNNLFNELSLI